MRKKRRTDSFSEMSPSLARSGPGGKEKIMSETIDLKEIPQRKPRKIMSDPSPVEEYDQLLDILEHILPGDFYADQPLTERVRLLVERVSELEQQLAEAQAKAELWEKIKEMFFQGTIGRLNKRFWMFFGSVTAREDESFDDAVRRLA